MGEKRARLDGSNYTWEFLLWYTVQLHIRISHFEEYNTRSIRNPHIRISDLLECCLQFRAILIAGFFSGPVALRGDLEGRLLPAGCNYSGCKQSERNYNGSVKVLRKRLIITATPALSSLSLVTAYLAQCVLEHGFDSFY